MKIDTSQNPAEHNREPCSRTAKRDLKTVRQFCEAHSAFTQGSLRWLLFHRRTNGLARAVFQVGRRVLIDVDAFFAWLDEQNRRS